MNKEGRREEPKGQPRYFEIDRLLASHRDRYPPAQDPPNTLLLAYEDRRFKKMARQLLVSEDELKSKILIELVQDLANSVKIVRASLKTDMMEVLGHDYEWHQEKVMDLPSVDQPDLIEVLVVHLAYENDEIRELAVKAVAQFCKIMTPRQIALVQKFHVDIKQCIHDKVPEIRSHAYTAMLAMTRMTEASSALISIDMVATLVDKLLHEKEEHILLQVHELLRQLLLVEGGTKKLVEIEDIAIERMCNFIASANWELKEATLKNLYSTSFDYDGKELMLKHNCALRILPLLSDQKLEVRTAAALVVASLVQLNEAKHQIVDNGHFASVIKMLTTEKEDEILLNLIQLVTSCAEDNSKGRKEAFIALPQLQKFADDESSVLSMYAKDAIEVITWKP